MVLLYLFKKKKKKWFVKPQINHGFAIIHSLAMVFVVKLVVIQMVINPQINK